MTYLTVVKERSSWRVPGVRRFEKLIERARRYVAVPDASAIALIFVGSAAIRRLNAHYRGKQKATDVLSFAYTKTKTRLEGDIVICIPVAKRQANTIGNTPTEEVFFLFVHGFLHLLGYDHERSRAEEKRMFQLQDKILGRT